MADRTAAASALHQVVTPGDDMGAGHAAKLVLLLNAGEAHKIFDGVFVGTPGATVGQVGEPFDFGRHVGQTQESFGGQQPFLSWKDGTGFWGSFKGSFTNVIKLGADF